MNTAEIIKGIENKDVKALARLISCIENNTGDYRNILSVLKLNASIPVIGITGPPGAGKSTLLNALLSVLVKQNKKVAVVAVDPTSPFTSGSLLGDRVRMADHYNNPNIYIRSLAARGSLGGLTAKTFEVTDALKSFDFDYIFIETVGVGQSEIEIAGLADVTVLVLVPEAGDEVQTLKSGIMEIANIYVLNKSDRDGADLFYKSLKEMVHSGKEDTAVIKTVASSNSGIEELMNAILFSAKKQNKNKHIMLAEKAYKLIAEKRMSNVDKKKLREKLEKEISPDFNLYKWIESNY